MHIKFQMSVKIPLDIHTINLQDDERHYFLGSSFGFRRGGLLTITVSGFQVDALSSTSSSPAIFDKEKDGHVWELHEIVSYFDKTADLFSKLNNITLAVYSVKILRG